MINKVILLGRLTKDIELKKTQSNLSVATFTIAVDKIKKEQGADFIQCQAWKQQAEFLSQYAHKGSKIAVEGRISTRNYEDENGKHYITEVVCEKVELCESKKEEPKQDSYEDFNNERAGYPSNNPKLNGDYIDSDELPFY